MNNELNKWILRLPIAPNSERLIYMVDKEDIKELITLIKEARADAVRGFVEFIKSENGWDIGIRDDDYNITSLIRHEEEYLKEQNI